MATTNSFHFKISLMIDHFVYNLNLEDEHNYRRK